MGGKEYRETVDITTREFFDYVNNADVLPTTAQVTMAQIKEVYDKLADEGYDEVISIHLSSGITGFLDNLRMFVKDYDRLKVFPYDSKMASAGEGVLSLLAGAMASEGFNSDQILPKLDQLRGSEEVYFAVDNLNHLMRTGRLTNRSAFIGNILRIKPLLTFDEDGKIVGIGKERTMRRAFNSISSKMAESIAKADYPIQATIINANDEELAEKWRVTLSERFPNLRILVSDLGPVVSVHTGEKTMGVMWSEDWQAMY